MNEKDFDKVLLIFGTITGVLIIIAGLAGIIFMVKSVIDFQKDSFCEDAGYSINIFYQGEEYCGYHFSEVGEKALVEEVKRGKTGVFCDTDKTCWRKYKQ